jgi:23S rRNA pseudouridine2605 synthase
VRTRSDRLLPESAPAPQRLQKVLARAGIASRRASEELIADGRVTINDQVATLGDRADVTIDVIAVDGTVVSTDVDLVHYLLQKPAGVICTADDPGGRPTAIDLVPAEPRVWTVGRLDVETEGLLLLTNDGPMTQRLTHPSHGIEKEYLVQVERQPSPGTLRRLREGIDLDDGPTAPARVASPGDGLVRITIHEGRNRQVRRMFDAAGHPVRRLVRIRIGPLAERSLAPGEWRPLTRIEVLALDGLDTGGLS